MPDQFDNDKNKFCDFFFECQGVEQCGLRELFVDLACNSSHR